MSREHVDETASAAMDGEADELELRRFLKSLAEENNEERARWARYQLARDVLHNSTPLIPTLDLAASVSAALDQEAVQEKKSIKQDVTSKKTPRGYSTFWRFGVAASVTFAVLGSVRWYNQGYTALAVASQTPATTQSHWAMPASAPALRASFSAPSAPLVLEEKKNLETSDKAPITPSMETNR